ALRLGNPGLHSLDCVGFGREKRRNEVLVGYECMVPARGDDGLEVVADVLPPVHKDSGALELVENTKRNELLFDGGEKLVPDIRQFLAVAQQGEVVAHEIPPGLKRSVMGSERLLESNIPLKRSIDLRFNGDGRIKGQIARTLWLEESVAGNAEFCEFALFRSN